MISQREELRNKGKYIQQQQNGVDGESTIILQENGLQPNVNNKNNNRGQRMKWGKTVKHRYYPLLLQYHSKNTKSTLQKSLSHSMDNASSRKPANRTGNL